MVWKKELAEKRPQKAVWSWRGAANWLSPSPPLPSPGEKETWGEAQGSPCLAGWLAFCVQGIEAA